MTLSAGTAVVEARLRRQIAGGLSLVGAVVLLSILVLMVSGHLHALDGEADVETATLDPKQLVNENTVVSKANAVPGVPAASRASPAGSSVPVDSRPIEIAASAAVGGASLSRTDLKSEKTARCAGLLAEKQWPALSACAAELDAAGERERARSFQAVAMLETASEVTDRKVRQALSAQNLKEAQRLLKQMAPGSVYYKPLGDLFDQAEFSKAEDTKRIVQTYLDGHDCGGLRRSLSQDLGASATERVVTMFSHAIATCTERTEPGTNKAETSSTRPALSLPPPSPGSSKKPAKDESGSDIGEPPEMLTPPDVAVSKEPVRNRHGQGAQLAASPLPSNASCDHIDADAIITMAETQFNAGYALTALVLMKKALQCKESVHMYRLAGMCACRAHDVEAARRYLNRVPA